MHIALQCCGKQHGYSGKNSTVGTKVMLAYPLSMQREGSGGLSHPTYLGIMQLLDFFLGKNVVVEVFI